MTPDSRALREPTRQEKTESKTIITPTKLALGLPPGEVRRGNKVSRQADEKWLPIVEELRLTGAAPAANKLRVRPYGLHPKMTLEEYYKDSVCALSWFNYKVTASVGTSIRNVEPTLAINDTGCGSNIVREGCCPPSALEQIEKKREIVNLSSASRHRLDTRGWAVTPFANPSSLCVTSAPTSFLAARTPTPTSNKSDASGATCSSPTETLSL